MKERTRNFQGLRFLFLIGIAAMHGKMTFLGEGGHLCSFFFIISGFFYKQPQDLKQYYIRKITKLFPFYWLCMILYFILFGWKIKWDIIPHLFLLQSFFPAPNTAMYYYKYLGVAWFLSSLWFCYLISPFIHKKIFSKVNERNSVLAVIILLLAIYVMRSIPFTSPSKNWWFYINPAYRFLEYSIGVFLKKAIENKEQIELPHPNLVSFVVFVLYFTYLHLKLPMLNTILLHTVIIYFMYVYKSPLIDAVFGNKVIVSLAKYGMFMYLSHQFLNIYFRNILGVNTFYSLFCCVLVGMLLGVLYKHTIERLFLRNK